MLQLFHFAGFGNQFLLFDPNRFILFSCCSNGLLSICQKIKNSRLSLREGEQLTFYHYSAVKSMQEITQKIKTLGKVLGFQQIGITNTDLSHYEARFKTWLNQQFHGEMSYMASHGQKRMHPEDLLPGTMRIISARMDYLPPDTFPVENLRDRNRAYIARYALGRDYHRFIRKRLAMLAEQINDLIHPQGYRAFCDSAPILEKPLAEKAGLGWIGKHTNLINSKAGSWFFLGEIYTNLPLPIDEPTKKSHCGSCQACIDICPTQAIVAPYKLDARRCISYLTIELRTAIPIELRPLIGNRIYGCDDCQLICPWNKFARSSKEKDFHPRESLHSADLLTLFSWTKEIFLEKTAG